MILGVGTDIVDIGRIQSLLERRGRAFKRRVFTLDEQEKAESSVSPAHSYAKRFAAKEAFVKAIQTFEDGIRWTEIGVINDISGAPKLILTGSALKKIQSLHPQTKVFVSLSDTKTFAQAFVVIAV